MKVCLKIKKTVLSAMECKCHVPRCKTPSRNIRRGERKQLGLIPKLVNFPLIPFFSFSLFLLSFYLKFKIKIYNPVFFLCGMSHGMSCRSTQTLSCIHGMTCHLLITSCKHPGNREAWKILFPLCTQRLRLLEILFFSSLTKILRKKSFRSSTFLTGWKDEKDMNFPWEVSWSLNKRLFVCDKGTFSWKDVACSIESLWLIWQ